jgi:hypothetical protein
LRIHYIDDFQNILNFEADFSGYIIARGNLRIDRINDLGIPLNMFIIDEDYHHLFPSLENHLNSVSFNITNLYELATLLEIDYETVMPHYNNWGYYLEFDNLLIKIDNFMFVHLPTTAFNSARIIDILEK